MSIRSIRMCVFAAGTSVLSVVLVGCQATPMQSEQVSSEESRISTSSEHLSDARSHFKRFTDTSGNARFESATWIVPGSYRGEVIFGERTRAGTSFKAIELKDEMRGYRYFGPELTKEVQWGERRDYSTNLTLFKVIDFIAIGTDAGVDRCSGFLGFWSDMRKRLSGFICNRTGYEADYPKAEDFLPTISVKGEFDSLVSR